MSLGLITLPLRLSLGAARVAVGVSGRAVGIAWEVVESMLAGRGSDGDGAESSPQESGSEPAAPASGEAPEFPEQGSSNGSAARDPRAEFERGDRRVEPRPVPPEPTVGPRPDPAAEPPARTDDHVSEGPEL